MMKLTEATAIGAFVAFGLMTAGGAAVACDKMKSEVNASLIEDAETVVAQNDGKVEPNPEQNEAVAKGSPADDGTPPADEKKAQ